MAFRIATVTGLLLAVAVQKTQASKAYFATDADPFLGRVVASRNRIISDIESALQNSSLKDGNDNGVDADLRKVEDRLGPIFQALPKNRYDRLSSAGVRYLLHRHFIHQRAWLVKGLAPEGRGWNESFPLETLATWAPDGLQTVLADHLDGRGLTLRECAVLATMLENQVHAEAVEILRTVWRLHGLKPEGAIDSAQMKTIIEDVMLVYLWVADLKLEINLSNLEKARRWTKIGFPSWPRTQQFLLNMQKEVAWSVTAEGLTFVTGEQIVMRVVQQYGGWQEDECRTLKQDLLAMEEPSRPGRVDLTVFHASAASGKHEEFVETASYLRELGVLDESVPARPEVIIPNYISSPANYVISGTFFSVACTDQCEELLGHVERRVGGPTATPDELAEIVSMLPSLESQQVVVSDVLIQQLRQVAALHGGRVPLHGRLFALWMHHAYPRDCQYPARAGTTKQILPPAYEISTGLLSAETPEELAADARRLAASAEMGMSTMPLSWDLNEELLQEPLPEDTIFRMGVIMAAIAATFSAGMAAVRLQPQSTRSATKIVI